MVLSLRAVLVIHLHKLSFNEQIIVNKKGTFSAFFIVKIEIDEINKHLLEYIG
ncbi:hypothetical protein PPBDW_I20701 [Photobacterium kishitanii]|nr:hypothetical protein PPBDW_I20701 [Photobacterium kishitanii]